MISFMKKAILDTFLAGTFVRTHANQRCKNVCICFRCTFRNYNLGGTCNGIVHFSKNFQTRAQCLGLKKGSMTIRILLKLIQHGKSIQVRTRFYPIGNRLRGKDPFGMPGFERFKDRRFSGTNVALNGNPHLWWCTQYFSKVWTNWNSMFKK